MSNMVASIKLNLHYCRSKYCYLWLIFTIYIPFKCCETKNTTTNHFLILNFNKFQNMGKKNRKSRNVQSSSEASARGSTEERTRDSKSIDARPKEKLLDKEDSVEAKSAKPETRKPLTEQQKQKLLEIEKVMRARAQKAKELKAKSNATTSESAKPPSGNPSKKTSSSEVPSQEAIKDLVSTIAKAASNRKQTASSSKSESDLKEDLASLLQQIRLDDITKQSPLGMMKAVYLNVLYKQSSLHLI